MFSASALEFFVISLHILLCLLLVLIILLQPGKGGDIGSAFAGGGTSTVFGPRGPANLLQRATTVVAVLFMVTSITLSLYSTRSRQEDLDVRGAVKQLQQEKAKPAPDAAPEAAPEEDEAP